MSHQLPRLPDAVRTLRDDESKHLLQQFPGIPKSLKDCPTCNGAKQFTWYRDYPTDLEAVAYECPCADQIRLYKYFLHAGLGKTYQMLNWGDLDQEIKNENAEALGAINKYCTDPWPFLSRGLGLMLYGGNGTGKTLLSSLILKRLLTTGRGLDGYFTTFTNLLDRYAGGWTDTDLANWFERRVTNADVLVIDDIGKEYVGRIGMSSNALDNVLRTRVQHARATIFTTNLSLADFRKTYSGSTWSLLTEKVFPYEIVGSYHDPKEGYRDRQRERDLEEIFKGLTRPIVWE